MKTCSTTTFKALMATQFFGALNDNVFRVVVSLIIVNAFASGHGQVAFLCVSEAFFILPFILFSTYAGFFADRFRKSLIIRATKVMEVIVMSFGCYFLITNNVYALVVVLLFMGLQSTLFSPSKYGILPEILTRDHLSRGNGYLEFWTFLAIIFGTAIGGVLKSLTGESFLVPGVAVICIAIVGLTTSLWITRSPCQNEGARFEWNFLKDVSKTVAEIHGDRGLFLALVATAYFWFLGTFFKLNTILFAKNLAGLGDLETAILFSCLGIGIGIGSIVAGVVSEGKIELGLVPLGAVGLSVFCTALAFTADSYPLMLVVLALLGASAGFFIVPLDSYYQHNSPEKSRGRYLAANNFVAFCGMLFSCFLVWFLIEVLGFDESQLFITVGLATVGATIYIIRTLPEMLLRCLNWMLTHTIYRVRVFGSEHVPKSGGALIVCNHVSFVDASLLMAALDRPVRYLIYRPIYEAKYIHPIARAMGAIPVSGGDSREAKVKSLALASEAISRGELVCIFAEGSITRTGTLLPFKRGFERIMKDVDAPIIPAYLDQIWGSVFSYRDGKFFWKKPRSLPYPVTISFGEQLFSDSKASQVRQAVQELSTEAFSHRRREFQLLHTGLLRVVKRNLFKPCMADVRTGSLRYCTMLAAVFALAERLGKRLIEGKMVGVLLPTSVAGALTNIALLFSGRVPVNLNFTASEEALRSALSQCNIKQVVTSKRFIEKLEISDLPQAIYVDDLEAEIGAAQKLKYLFAVLILPRYVLERFFSATDQSRDDLATVIFSSGSTGEPKGAMLSHGNIASNIESVDDAFQLRPDDCMLGILPFFHSFGFTGGLWLPLLSGVRVAFHHNPVEAKAIGELAAKHNATLLLSTPTFLLSYIRKVKPEQFASLRHVMVGAEKLKEKVAIAFHEKFGVMPMEGYGATELSPVAVINVPDYVERRGKQVGNKPGSVGHPIPGVAVKIVDPDSFATLQPGEEGLLLVKGPNVMQGYIGNPQLTEEVIRGGWYITGDIANIDDGGFVTITDRLSRFSKIAGEMVPHLRVEEEIQDVLNSVEPVCAVTGIPDDKKGEKLVVLVVPEIDAKALVKDLTERGNLPNLWIPRAENFLRIQELPQLGSGKLDLKAIKKIAQEQIA